MCAWLDKMGKPERISWLNNLGLGPFRCLAVSGVSEYLLQKTRDKTMVHGARALNALSGAAPSRELMEFVSGTAQSVDAASGP